MHIYIYIHVYVYVCVYIYIYIYICHPKVAEEDVEAAALEWEGLADGMGTPDPQPKKIYRVSNI